MGIERAKAIVHQSMFGGPDWRDELQTRLGDLHGECARLPISQAFKERIARFKERCAVATYYRDAPAAIIAIHELQIDFLNELEATLLLVLPTAAAGRWKRPASDWPPLALTKFNIGQDARAATQCLAVDQWTASVFHSMRVMDQGRRWLADKLAVPFSVPFEYQQWHTVIESIEKEIRKREGQLAKGDAKSDEITFYSKAASHFFFTKEAWRNHVAHSRTNYNENEATRVFNDVREFMRQLAERG